MIDIKITPPVSQIRAELNELEDSLKYKAVRSGLVAAIAPVKKTAKATAPKDLGALSQAIGHRMLSKSAKSRLGIPNESIGLLVGATRKVSWVSRDGKSRKSYQTAKYIWQEFGTKNMSANPFLGASLQTHESGLVGRFYQGLAKQLNKLQVKQ